MSKFWYDNIYILFQKDKLNQIIPTNDMSQNEKLNSIVRLFIYIGVGLYLITNNHSYLLLTIGSFVLTYMLHNKQFETFNNSLENNDYTQCDLPTDNNPFMNTNIIDPNRDKFNPCTTWNNPDVDKLQKEKFHNGLYRDSTNLYDKNNSQRQFFTVPFTGYPKTGDTVAFSKFCNSGIVSKPTCKEDSISCLPITSGGNKLGFNGNSNLML